MKPLTADLAVAFQRIVNEIQLKASLQDIHRIDEEAMNLRSFIAFAERVWEKQQKAEPVGR